MKFISVLIAACALLGTAQAAVNAPDLDLHIRYYSKLLTPEGVTREARYEETMLRRPGHVWVARVLPRQAQGEAEAVHKQFNHVVLPRHVLLENKQLRVEYVDAHGKEIVAIPPSEYENVNFDGSWENAYYLLDPKLVQALPLSAQASSVAGARWRERVRKGVFQRVLWDEQKQLALIIESGDQAATFYRRVEVKPQASLTRELPWQKLQAYAHKEYADFLD
ncbi:MAG: hypothetical protein HYZ65_12755 [Burkholderiales bacterium]|nr:hypothetical protein [Burkholderiales bacterium]